MSAQRYLFAWERSAVFEDVIGDLREVCGRGLLAPLRRVVERFEAGASEASRAEDMLDEDWTESEVRASKRKARVALAVLLEAERMELEDRRVA